MDNRSGFAYGAERGVSYRLYTPESAAPRPLILYLHGEDLIGTDNERQLREDWGAYALRDRYPDMMVLAPQCPVPFLADEGAVYRPYMPAEGDPFAALRKNQERNFRVDGPDGAGGWTRDLMARVIGIVQDLIQAGKADPARIYVTGSSMGGAGAIRALHMAPGLFAGAVPVSPYMDSRSFDELCALTGTPIWIAAAFLDDDFDRGKWLFDGVCAQLDGGNNARLTLYSRQELQARGIGMAPGTTLAQQLLMNRDGAKELTYRGEKGILDWLTAQRRPRGL